VSLLGSYVAQGAAHPHRRESSIVFAVIFVPLVGKKRSRREKEQRRCILPRFEVVTQLSACVFVWEKLRLVCNKCADSVGNYTF
jgi:phage gp37-like protein